MQTFFTRRFSGENTYWYRLNLLNEHEINLFLFSFVGWRHIKTIFVCLQIDHLMFALTIWKKVRTKSKRNKTHIDFF